MDVLAVLQHFRREGRWMMGAARPISVMDGRKKDVLALSRLRRDGRRTEGDGR